MQWVLTNISSKDFHTILWISVKKLASYKGNAVSYIVLFQVVFAIRIEAYQAQAQILATYGKNKFARITPQRETKLCAGFGLPLKINYSASSEEYKRKIKRKRRFLLPLENIIIPQAIKP